MRRLLTPLVVLAAMALPGVARAESAVVNVSVATLWKQPGLVRAIDAPALAVPADPRGWSRNLATTGLRLWLDSHVQTQAVYGEEVVVLARRGRWDKVAVVDQPDPQNRSGYPGWVPARQLTALRQAPLLPSVVVTAPTAWLHAPSGRPLLELSFATRLPLIRLNGSDAVVLTPTGRQATLARGAVSVLGATHRPTGAMIVATARRFLGVHYLWGGLSAFGYDCSGLVWAAFRSFGMTIPRDADPQFRSGLPVSTGALRVGDLLFYGTQRYVHHVAIYAGHGLMLEAPDSAHRVRLVPMRWGELAGARRYTAPS